MSAQRIAGTIAAISAAGLVAVAVAAAYLGPAWAGTAATAMGPGMMTGGAGMMGGPGMMGGMGHGMGSSGHMGPGAGPMAMADVDSEFDYLANMIPHHEEAIASARVLLEGTARPEMRAFAQSVIDVQTSELSQLRTWLATWYPGRDATVAYEPMMRDLTGLRGNELDRAFLEDMIPHHMGAVMMSRQLVSQDLAEHDALVPFAERIRDAQHTEIFQMAAWLRDWFGISPMGARM